MRREVELAVLKVLQKSHCHGLAITEGCWSIDSGLPRWKRLVNRLCARLGAEQPAFIDPCNYGKTAIKPIRQIVDESLILEAMFELSPPPKCNRCGGSNLLPDPPATIAMPWISAERNYYAQMKSAGTKGEK